MPKAKAKSQSLVALNLALEAGRHAKICQGYVKLVDAFFETVLGKAMVWNATAQQWAVGPFLELRETLDDVFGAMIVIMKKSHVKAFRTEVDTFMHTIAVPLRSFVHLSSNVHIANVKSVLKEVSDALNQLATSWESERLSTNSANAKLLIQGWDRVMKRLHDCIGSNKPEHRGKSGWKYIRTGQFD